MHTQLLAEVVQVAMTELKLIKAFDRIDALIEAGSWGFRQPKKQRSVGGSLKTHWDYLLDEMVIINAHYCSQYADTFSEMDAY